MVYNVHVVAAYSRWRYDNHHTCFHVDVHGQWHADAEVLGGLGRVQWSDNNVQFYCET